MTARARHLCQKPAFTVVLGNYSILFIATITGLVLARTLGPTGRGDLGVIMAWLGVSVVVGELGQSAASVYYTAKRPEHARAIWRDSMRIMLVGAGTGATVVIVVQAVPAVRFEPGLAGAFIVGILALNAFVGPLTYSLQARNFTVWTVVRLAHPIIYLICILGSASFHAVSLTAVLIAYLCATSLQLFVAMGAVYVLRVGDDPGNLPGSYTRRLTSYGVSVFAGAVPLVLLTNLDRIILGLSVQSADIGLYVVALTWVSLAQPFAVAVGSVRFSLISREFSDPALSRLRRGHIAALGGFLLLACVGGYVLIPILFGADFVGAAYLTLWLAPAAFCDGLTQIIGDIVRGRGFPNLVARAHWIGLGVFAMFMPTVSSLGVYGAALALGSGRALVLIMLIRKGLNHRPQ